MDPNETLLRLRAAVKERLNALDSVHCVPEFDYDEYEMAELFDVLDRWLSRSGFRPAAWSASA